MSHSHLSGPVGTNAALAAGFARDKGISHFRRRPQNIAGRSPAPARPAVPREQRHRRHSALQDAGQQPAPAGMRGSDHRAPAIAEQHRQAIGRHHHADRSRLARKCRVGLRRFSASRSASTATMPCTCLSQSGSPGNAARSSLAVRRNGGRIVADMIAEIEARPRRPADAAVARRLQGPDIGRRAQSGTIAPHPPRSASSKAAHVRRQRRLPLLQPPRQRMDQARRVACRAWRETPGDADRALP